MPIFYNFYILLATIYMILLDQHTDLVPSASSCLLHVFCFIGTHIKRSPNAIKTYGDFFWNICQFWEKESTRDDARGGHKAGGAPQGVGRALGPCGHSVRRLVPFFSHKKANIRIKIMLKFQPNRSYGSLGI